MWIVSLPFPSGVILSATTAYLLTRGQYYATFADCNFSFLKAVLLYLKLVISSCFLLFIFSSLIAMYLEQWVSLSINTLGYVSMKLSLFYPTVLKFNNNGNVYC